MAQFLWRLFEKSGNVSAYLFYKAMEETEKKKFYRTIVEVEKKVVER